MKRNAIFLAALAILLSACGTVPQSREHFIELMRDYDGAWSSQKLIYEKEVDKPFDQVVANIENRLNACVPEGYTQATARGNSLSTNTVSNFQRIERVSADRAEITVQQHHTDSFRQSEGGFYLLAADVTRRGEDAVLIDFYTNKHYASIAQAVEKWSEGSRMCHGIGGNP